MAALQQTVVVFSGGLDSTTLLYHLRAEGHEVKALTINYQQKHSKEIEHAKGICADLDVEHCVLELQGLAAVLGNNALMDNSIDIPGGEYADGTIQVTTVPNRNMIFL